MNNINYYLHGLERIVNSLRKRISQLEAERKHMPDGFLFVRRRDSGLSCYVSARGAKKSVPAGSETAEALARKRHLIRELVVLKFLAKGIASVLEGVDDVVRAATGRGERIFEVLPELFDNVQLSHTKKERDWYARMSLAEEFRTDEKIYSTKSGFNVRSMSERLIADTIYKFKLLFFYEPEIIIGGETFRPDFIILLPDGRVFIWEHFGRMDDESYRQHAKYKLAKYREAGFHPQINLICTYGEDIKDEAVIERIVRERLCRI
ncbi:MAG: hypothetical protein MR991_04695 [Clostridiales bacterium]|nr:hypothetical protein [Clostridiales bacterium]MDD7036006.1 hypothetical protein [Bacillota bacterium]MDY2921101.1 hypothetical protein [Lentihominibacter sp.]